MAGSVRFTSAPVQIHIKKKPNSKHNILPGDRIKNVAHPVALFLVQKQKVQYFMLIFKSNILLLYTYMKMFLTTKNLQSTS